MKVIKDFITQNVTRCDDKGGKSAPKFIPSSNYHKEEETPKLTIHPIQSHPSTLREK
jgi:hypothetical protein